MNVYDEAHKLKQAIKESQEYIQYEAVKEKVKANPQLEQNLKDFHITIPKGLILKDILGNLNNPQFFIMTPPISLMTP